jgi:hypothetical protein
MLYELAFLAARMGHRALRSFRRTVKDNYLAPGRSPWANDEAGFRITNMVRVMAMTGRQTQRRHWGALDVRMNMGKMLCSREWNFVSGCEELH